MDIEHTKALKERAQLGRLVAMTSGVRNGDHWYICDENESVAMISANDGVDEELRQPRAELFAHAVNTLPALVAAVERVQALHTPICEHSGTNCKSPICPMLVCQSCGDDYPCPTIRALETP